jgi:hypothetical protein
MTQQRKSGTTDPAYRYLHLSAEELAQLPQDDLLQACLELRRLLEIIRGILYTPDSTLILRAVTIDLLFSEAERLSRQQGVSADAPVTYEIKEVSQRLGIRPVSVRQAYEQLNALGGVHILARQFPGRREQQMPLPLENTETRKDND